VARASQVDPHRVLPVGQVEIVIVDVTVVVVVVTGVGAVVVLAVMPQHEQALLYAEVSGQAEA
jgi:hypothetical protein